MSRDRPFAQPVALRKGPPAPERETREWRLAIQMLIDAAEDRGPMLFAWMGIVRALEANLEEAPDTERQSLRRGKPKQSKPTRERAS